MKDGSEQPGNYFIKVLINVFLVSIFLTINFFIIFIESSHIKELTFSLGESISRDISLRMNNSFSSLIALGYTFETEGELTQERFETLSRYFIREFPNVSFLQHKNALTVTDMVYPLRGNESTLGQSLIDNEQALKSLEKAKQTRTLTVNDPYMLKQGFLGMIARYPVFIDDEFAGLYVCGINLDEFLSFLSKKEVLGSHAYSFFDSTGKIFFESATGGKKYFSQEFRIPIADSFWILEIYSKNNYWMNFILYSIILWGLYLLVTFFVGSLEHKLNRKDQLIKELKDLKIKLTEEAYEKETIAADLRKGQELYRNMFYSNTSIMFLIDPMTLYIYDANPAAVKFYGYPLEEFRKLKISQINVLGDDVVQKSVNSVIDSNFSFFSFKHKLSDGTIKDVEVHASKVQINDKAYIYSIIHDVTSRIKMQEKLNLIARLQSIVVDIATKVINLSSFYIEDTVSTALEELGKLLEADRIVVVFNEDKSGYKNWEWKTPELSSKEVCSTYSDYEDVLKQLDKSDKDFLFIRSSSCLSVFIPMNTDGKISGFIGMSSNSKDYSFDPQVLKAVKLIAQTIASGIKRKEYENIILAEKEEAERASYAKTSFISRVSHELRTPMNGIIMGCQIAQACGSLQEIKEYTELIKRSADSLMSLIEDLLDLSKIEAGDVDLQILDFNVENVLRYLEEEYRSMAKDKGLDFFFSVDEKVPSKIYSDPGKITRILKKLLDNSIKFTEKGF
ncbi:MAG TPA: histidine kinase dimerization/phospho-acceptor domain-containing protein, partial [Petrotogaceae bacterium]|nr:histidine kinase dimerization/phospho-acceptor domain-containing protein [Petrotogaceae bacterium]